MFIKLSAMIFNTFFSFWGVEPDQSIFEKHIAALDKKLSVYDQILSKQKYLAGDVSTLMDLIPGNFTENLNVRTGNHPSGLVSSPLWLDAVCCWKQYHAREATRRPVVRRSLLTLLLVGRERRSSCYCLMPISS